MFQKKKKKLNLYDLIPSRLYGEETDESGIITVLIPRFKNNRLSKLLIPKSKSKFIKLKLDENGSKVWSLIDGTKNVQQICNSFADLNDDKLEQSDERVIKFIDILYKQKCILIKENQSL